MAKQARKLRERSTPDLEAGVVDLREQLFKLRWQSASGQVESPMKIRQVRREIARHLTLLRERSAQPGQGAS